MPKKQKLPRGAQTRIAAECEVTQSMVSMVLAGKAVSEKITAAIERELAKIKVKPAGAEANS